MRGRWMHRRRIIQLIGVAILVPVIGVGALSGDGERVAEVENPIISIPEDHRVLSLPVDERVPPLEPGDSVDLYLAVDDFAGVDGDITLLDDVGLVVSVRESAFSLAIPNERVGTVAEAVRDGGVLVVRR